MRCTSDGWQWPASPPALKICADRSGSPECTGLQLKLSISIKQLAAYRAKFKDKEPDRRPAGLSSRRANFSRLDSDRHCADGIWVRGRQVWPFPVGIEYRAPGSTTSHNRIIVVGQ